MGYIDSKGRPVIAAILAVKDGRQYIAAMVDGPDGYPIVSECMDMETGVVIDEDGNRVFGPGRTAADDAVGAPVVPGEYLN